MAQASKVVTLVDLAGHERYFKTTAYGLTGHLPDYACLIVGANAGRRSRGVQVVGVVVEIVVQVHPVGTAAGTGVVVGGVTGACGGEWGCGSLWGWLLVTT